MQRRERYCTFSFGVESIGSLVSFLFFEEFYPPSLKTTFEKYIFLRWPLIKSFKILSWFVFFFFVLFFEC